MPTTVIFNQQHFNVRFACKLVSWRANDSRFVKIQSNVHQMGDLSLIECDLMDVIRHGAKLHTKASRSNFTCNQHQVVLGEGRGNVVVARATPLTALLGNCEEWVFVLQLKYNDDEFEMELRSRWSVNRMWGWRCRHDGNCNYILIYHMID